MRVYPNIPNFIDIICFKLKRDFYDFKTCSHY